MMLPICLSFHLVLQQCLYDHLSFCSKEVLFDSILQGKMLGNDFLNLPLNHYLGKWFCQNCVQYKTKENQSDRTINFLNNLCITQKAITGKS